MKQEMYFKERYEIKCPYCGSNLNCSPSIFHRMGHFDLGSGSCIDCHKMFEIKFLPESNEMKTFKMEEK